MFGLPQLVTTCLSIPCENMLYSANVFTIYAAIMLWSAGGLSKKSALDVRLKTRSGSGCKQRRTLSWKGSKPKQKLCVARRLKRKRKLG